MDPWNRIRRSVQGAINMKDEREGGRPQPSAPASGRRVQPEKPVLSAAAGEVWDRTARFEGPHLENYCKPWSKESKDSKGIMVCKGAFFHLDPIASIDHRELEVGRLVSGRWCFIFPILASRHTARSPEA